MKGTKPDKLEETHEQKNQTPRLHDHQRGRSDYRGVTDCKDEDPSRADNAYSKQGQAGSRIVSKRQSIQKRWQRDRGAKGLHDEGVRTPSLVAQSVMDNTDHHLIVGRGAQDFARGMGFKIEDDLNTDNSRRQWLEWKRRIDPSHYLDPKKRAEAGHRAALEMLAEGLLREENLHGTINCDGINSKGEICGVTTTSGLAWKIPGRLGDSPILGAGLYVDGAVGAAGSTGRGEANLYNLCSFVIIEEMRRGVHPKDAGMEVLKRIKANTVEKRLLKPDGNPNFSINFYILNAKGEYAGVSMYQSKYAMCNENGPQTLATEPLLPGKPSE